MSEIATWPAVDAPGAAFPFEIAYSRGVFERIRQSAMQGLMDLPKVGLGIGGVLLGEREGPRIIVVDAFEIQCSHAAGPSFNLTPDERAQARGSIMSAGNRVIGWYLSKGLRPLELTDPDLDLLASLFSGPWNLGLLIQPHMVRPARLRFCAMDASRGLLKGEPGDLAIWHDDEPPSTFTPAPPAQPLPESVRAEPEFAAPAFEAPKFIEPFAQPGFAQPAFIKPAHPAPKPAQALPRESEIAEPAPPYHVVTTRIATTPGWAGEPDPFAVLSRTPTPHRRAGSKWLLGAAAAVLLAASGTGVFVLNRDPEPANPPALALESTDANGTLVFRWNGDALKGFDHALLLVNDGGQLHTFPLTGFQLRSGEWRYNRKSRQVTASMTAGNAQAVTSFDANSATSRKRPAAPAH
jgi:hypothetical protein